MKTQNKKFIEIEFSNGRKDIIYEGDRVMWQATQASKYYSEFSIGSGGAKGSGREIGEVFYKESKCSTEWCVKMYSNLTTSLESTINTLIGIYRKTGECSTASGTIIKTGEIYENYTSRFDEIPK